MVFCAVSLQTTLKMAAVFSVMFVITVRTVLFHYSNYNNTNPYRYGNLK